MDRQHLDGLGVGLQAAAALLVGGVAARPRRSAGAATPVSAVVPELLGRRRGVQQLADVAQVGQPALAVGGRAARAPGRPSTSVIVSVSEATPAPRSTRAQSCRRRWTLLPLVLVGGGDLLGASSRGTASAPRRARAAVDAGRSSASSSRSHSRAGGGAEHAARAVDDRGDAGGVERVADQRGVAVACARARRRGRAARARRRRRVAPRRRAARDEVGGEVARRCARARTALLRVAARGVRLDPGRRGRTTRTRSGARRARRAAAARGRPRRATCR